MLMLGIGKLGRFTPRYRRGLLRSSAAQQSSAVSGRNAGSTDGKRDPTGDAYHAPAATVSGALKTTQVALLNRAPNAQLINIIEYTAMTRPLRWSATRLNQRAEAAICTIMQNPTGTRRTAESQKPRRRKTKSNSGQSRMGRRCYPAAKASARFAQLFQSADQRARRCSTHQQTQTTGSPVQNSSSAKIGINTA